MVKEKLRSRREDPRGSFLQILFSRQCEKLAWTISVGGDLGSLIDTLGLGVFGGTHGSKLVERPELAKKRCHCAEIASKGGKHGKAAVCNGPSLPCHF